MKIQAHADAELSHAQLQELTNRLVDKRRELADMIEALNLQISAKDDCSIADAAEAASVQESRVRAGSIADQNRQTIAEIDDALKRLASGQYGVSDTTGEPIAYERLLLVPWARTGAVE
jgi:DnaK suppressor protein